MEVPFMMLPSLWAVLEKLQDSWPVEDRITISSDLDKLTWRDGHPFASQLVKLESGKSCSLPFIGSANKVNWATFGGSQEELLEVIEDLRCWVFPYLGKEEQTAVVNIQNASKPQEQAFCAAAGWYFRWYCPTQNLEKVVKRLDALSALLESRPSQESRIPPSLNGLRFEFVSALRIGDWSAARNAVDAIDQWQLDTARNTQLMRIRLLYEEGDLVSLITTIRRSDVLEGYLPFRIRGVVVDAIYQSDLFPIEESRGWGDAFSHYRSEWHTKLAPHVIAQRSVAPNFPLSAYQAYSDCDRETLKVLCSSHNMELACAMLGELPATIEPTEEESEKKESVRELPPSIGRIFWEKIESAVKSGTNIKAKEWIAELTDADLGDPDWITVGAETLLGMFTDPQILDDSRSKLIAEEVLWAIIDVVVNNRNFPRREHAVIYESLISSWVVARGDSNSEQDGQLLLGLVGASLECNAESIDECESAVRCWWDKRKNIRRLPWLLGALDTLVQNHPNPSNLQNLWIDGVDHISRLGVRLSKSEHALWRLLGGFVGLDSEMIRTILAELPEAVGPAEIDPLSALKLRKVAVVSLQERAARQAAEELKSRTGAEVLIVTSTSAGELTRTAESADLILFVWAASTHAVYRAFDHVREKLQYVQGTGPTSIMLAAERWAVNQQSLQ